MIYCDYNATTPVDEEVLKVMLPWFTEHFGNASSSTHPFGWKAESAIENARQQLATAIGAEAQEVYFTSGATEGANLIIRGLWQQWKGIKNKVLVSSTEHKAFLETCHALEKEGAHIIDLPVNQHGIVDSDFLKGQLDDQVIAVVVMMANNETGILQSVKELAEMTHANGSVFVSDMVQALGKIPLQVKDYPLGAAVFSSHKIYGPKGVGAIYLSRKNPRISLAKTIFGGSQEKDVRPGTSNVPGIVGFGKAVEIATSRLGDYQEKMLDLTTYFMTQLKSFWPNVVIHGETTAKIPNTLNISFPDMFAKTMIAKIKTVAVSSGSACTSANPKPSHVLMAMGVESSLAENTIRFSFGWPMTRQHVDEIISELKVIKKNIST